MTLNSAIEFAEHNLACLKIQPSNYEAWNCPSKGIFAAEYVHNLADFAREVLKHGVPSSSGSR